MGLLETTKTEGDVDTHTIRMSECPECMGSGGHADSEGDWIKCWRCGGTGDIPA